MQQCNVEVVNQARHDRVKRELADSSVDCLEEITFTSQTARLDARRIA